MADLVACPVTEEVESYYYATCFAADNNALEVRSLLRSGETEIPQVKAAREAFFNQPYFKSREIWDRYLFDGDRKSAFSIAMRWGDIRQQGQSGFHLDLGEVQRLDRLVIHTFDEYSLAPLKSEEGVQAYVSADLKSWKEITFLAGKEMEIDLREAVAVRYIRFSPCPLRLNEVEGYRDGQLVDRSAWRANNLFRTYGSADCLANGAWKGSFTLSADRLAEDSYLCVAVNGVHGVEGAWVGFKVDGQFVGCPDRAPSYTSNTWESKLANSDRNYTYYLPVTREMAGKPIEVVVMSLGRNTNYVNTDRPDTDQKADTGQLGDLRPEVWLTTSPL